MSDIPPDVQRVLRLGLARLGRAVVSPSYIIFRIGGMVYAKNGLTGRVEYSSTDASDVIQYAIDALGERGGKVFIKRGDYYLPSRISIKSNVTVEGEGYATRLYSDQYIDDHISLSFSKNAGIRRLRIELPRDSTVYAIKTYNAENCIIDSIYLNAGRGIELIGKNCVLQNSYLEGSGAELVGEWGVGAGGVGNRIINNMFVGWGHNCVMGAPNYGIIANNYFYNFWDDAIDPNGNNNVVIVGNVCDKVNAETVGAFVSLEHGCERFIIANNLVRGMGGLVAVWDSKDVVIVGNRFFKPSISGARLVLIGGSSDGVHVVGNLAEAQSLVSIEFDDRTVLAKKIVVEDNVLIGTLNPAYIAYIRNAVGVIVKNNFGSIYGFDNGPHIVEEGDSDLNIIEGNIGHSWEYPFRDYKLFITKAGSGTIVRRNIGYRSENSGVATIPAGSTRVTVNHGLATAPSKVMVTPYGNIRVWVENITGTSFDIVTDTAPTTNVNVAWYAEV
jgi:hypothetical protein